MNVTFFGTYDTKTTPRIQVIIDGLREHGINVHECNAPLRVSTAERVAVLRQAWRVPMFVARILWAWLKLAMLSRSVPSKGPVIIGHLGHFDIHLARRLFRKRQIILDYMISGASTAHDRRINGSLKNKLVSLLDDAALRAADVIILDTQEHHDALPKRYYKKGVVVNVGADNKWFATASRQPLGKKTPKRTRIAFFGWYTPLQGTPIIGRAFTLMKEPAEVTMIGSGQDLAETKEFASEASEGINITWLDGVDPDELPAMVAEHDICLGIFGTGPKASKVVPNKVYQGQAAGCVIVTSDTPPQRRVLGNTAFYVPTGDSNALARQLDQLIREKTRLAALRKVSLRFAQQHFTPKQVVSPLLMRIQE